MGCRRYLAANRLEVLLDEDDSRTHVLRAPHRLTRPAFEAHPGANTFPPEGSHLNGPIRFPHHLFSDYGHGQPHSS